jgi:WD40 repeat protein
MRSPAILSPELTGAVKTLAFTPDGKTLAVGIAGENRCVLYKPFTVNGKIRKSAFNSPAGIANAFTNPVESVCFSPDGKNKALPS